MLPSRDTAGRASRNLPAMSGPGHVVGLSHATDGHGPISWAKHTYTRYGLVMSSGIRPEFGDQTMTRSAAPNTHPS